MAEVSVKIEFEDGKYYATVKYWKLYRDGMPECDAVVRVCEASAPHVAMGAAVLSAMNHDPEFFDVPQESQARIENELLILGPDVTILAANPLTRDHSPDRIHT